MKQCKPGTLVICDSFSGLLKGKVISIYQNEVYMRVTSRKNKAYRANDTCVMSKAYVFPANCFHHVRGKPTSFYVEPFEWRTK